MSNASRLHPATILFNFLKLLREGFFLIIIGFISFRESIVYFSLALAAILLIGLLFSVLSWYRFTYRIEDEELRIEYGIIIRKKRYISKNRIQSIDLTAGVIHRLFKLVKVQIETAGSGTAAEASLKAVNLTEGERLRVELKRKKSEIGETEIPEPSNSIPSETITFQRLFLAGVTSGSIGIILAFVVFVFSEIEQFIPDEFYNTTIEWLIGLGIVIAFGLVIILLVVFWLFGIAGTMIKYWKFTITKHDEELFITRGLLEKKQLTIPLKRIQAIGIDESIIRQPFGFVRVFAEVAGGSLEKGEDFSTVLFPIMRKEEALDFLEEFLPGYTKQQEGKWLPLPKRALKFYLFRSSILFIIATIAVIYFLPQYSWIPIVLLILSFYLGYLRYKDAAYYVEGQQLLIRYRNLSRKSMIIFHKRIQALEKNQHPLHKSQRLAAMRISIVGKNGTGKHYRIKELEEETADELSDWYSYQK